MKRLDTTVLPFLSWFQCVPYIKNSSFALLDSRSVVNSSKQGKDGSASSKPFAQRDRRVSNILANRIAFIFSVTVPCRRLLPCIKITSFGCLDSRELGTFACQAKEEDASRKQFSRDQPMHNVNPETASTQGKHTIYYPNCTSI